MAKLIQKNVNPKAILSTPRQTWKERVMKKLLSFSVITSVLLWKNRALADEDTLSGVVLGPLSTPFTNCRKLIFLIFLLAFIISFILSIFKKISWLWPFVIFLLASCYVMMIEIFERLYGINLINFIVVGIALTFFFLTFVLALFQKIRWRWLGIVFVILLLFVGASLLGL